MPSNAVVTFTAGSLGPEPCYADEQERFEAYVDALTGQLPGEYSTFVVGATEPDPDDRDKPWLQTEANGDPLRWYSYSTDAGAWVSLHPLANWAATGGMIYFGAEADIDAFDGGESGVVSMYGGPMWERVSALDARFPVQCGTLPSTTVIGPGSTGGEEEHELTESEMPPHYHEIITSGSGGVGTFAANQNPAVPSPTVAQTQVTGGSGTPTVVEGHNTMPPYYGVFFLRKTNRLYYRL